MTSSPTTATPIATRPRVGAANTDMPRQKLFAKVAAAVAVLVAATVALQARGLAPPMKTVGAGT